MTDAVIVLTTVPSPDVGEEIGRALVEERLAACVNVLPPMTSIYRWKGSVQREAECQVLIKTSGSRVGALQERLGELHPYDLPEFVVIPLDRGDPAYLAWIVEQASPEPA
jgi:periplasmic divalent cation tolerance protein